jgi:molybdopterin-guanine dinucleotide biosynthesis protein A
VNKALLDVGGRPIVERILSAVAPLVDERVLLANDASLANLEGVQVVFDPEPHAGVLPALAAGLEATSSELCLAVACDMPFVSTALFNYMLELQAEIGADVVIPRTQDYVEPMHAVYRRATVLRAIRESLAQGQQRMISYFSRVIVREVPQAEWERIDPSGRAFFNVNTPDDLAQARALADG